MRSLSLVLTLFLSVSASASAQPVTWMFTGTTTSTTSPDAGFTAQFPAGLPVSLRVTYNPAAPEQGAPFNPYLGNPAIGKYVLSNNSAVGVYYVDVETRIGTGRWHLKGSSEFIYVYANQGRVGNDGSFTEFIRGDLVNTLATWKPHYQTWSVQWPGVVFASDALPNALPNPHPAGSLQLNFFTCANNFLDPCPGGVQPKSRVNVQLSNASRVYTKQIDVKPGDPLNVINPATQSTPVAILGSLLFQPTLQVVRSTIELSKAPVWINPVTNQPACSTADVNNDGYLDLVCQVKTSMIAPREHESNVARLIARTIDGSYIQGSQTIQFVN